MQRILFSLAYFFTYTICAAQTAEPGGQYPFVHYTPKDGLVNSRVRKAYQDSKGRMYFITYGGLSVYNGAKFKNYTTQNGLLSALVNDVLEVGEDSLLVAVNTSGLNVLVHGQMKKLISAGNNCPVVNNFLKSHDGTIYAAADDGLYKWKQSAFEKLPALLPAQNDTAMFLGAIVEYKDFLVFGTNDLKNHKGLFLYNKKTSTIIDTWPSEGIFNLKTDINGIIWVSTYSNKTGNLDTAALNAGKLSLIQPYASYIKAGNFLPGNIVFNSLNEPIVSSYNKGIMHYRKDGTLLQIASPETSDFGGQSFFSDREDILWICHNGKGVYKLANTKLQSAGSYFNEDKSGIKTIRSNTPDTCWIFTNNGRISLITSSGKKDFSHTPPVAVNSLFYSGKKIYAADLNRLYLAAMPAANETAIRFTQIVSLPDSSGIGGYLVTDPYGNIIFFESRNICVLQNDKLMFTYPVGYRDLIEGMYIDKNKQLWIVSRNGGLQVFSIHPEKPGQYLQPEYQFSKEFEKSSPRCMVVDKNGLFWIGTRYDGLMAFEYKNNQLVKRHHFRTTNGLTDDFVTALTCDRNNNIVAGTQTGLDRLIKTTENNYRIENVTQSNNIFSFIDEVWTNTGDTIFALTNDVTVLQVAPVQNEKWQHEPQLLIEELKINGIPLQQYNSSLRLQYDQRNITFSLAAPTFINEKQVKFSYLLLGSGNNNWSDTTTAADITLLNLPPGNYSLHVKAFFASTPYAPKELFFPFSIMPPWWQTRWFRLLAGLFIVGVLVIAFRFYYRRKLEKQKAFLEKQQAVEKERTRIATDMHDDLGAGLSRIKFLSETIGIKQQQQQPVDEDVISIREYSHEMIDKMGEIVWALNEKNDSLSDLLSYTRSYAVEYLSQNGIQCEVNAPENFPAGFISGEFRRNIYLTVKEALHNVVKHAQATVVNLVFEADMENLGIEIKDNGTGFDKNNTRPFSNGLTNMEKRIKEIGGRLEILNQNGTLVRIAVQL